MVKFRKILFIIFTLFYLILFPTLILYSLGIVINPGKTKVVKTGVIYISSIPSGASVTMNGKPLNKETPTVIGNLLPGTYTLELSAKRYHPWKRTITVSAEKATPLEGILLIPDPLNIKELSPLPFNDIMPIIGNPYILAVNGPTIADIYIYIWDEGITQNLIAEDDNKTKASRLRLLFPTESANSTAKLKALYTAKGSPYLLFDIKTADEEMFLWIDPMFGTSKIEDITDLFPVIPTAVQWNSQDPRHLLSFQNSTINRVDIATKAIYPKTLDRIEAFNEYDQNIFFLTDEKMLKKSNHAGTNQQLVSDEPIINDLINSHSPFQKITTVTDNLTLLLDSQGGLLATLKPYLLAPKDIEGFKWNEKPPQLLIWTKHAIGIFNFFHQSDNSEQSQTPTTFWLTEEGRNISDAFWINDGNQILYVDDSKIFLSDTNRYEPPDIKEIVRIKKDSKIYYSDKIGKVFFLDQETHRLSTVEIVPQRTLLPAINFEQRNKNAAEKP